MTGIAKVSWRADPAADLPALLDAMIAAGAVAEGQITPRSDPGGGRGFSVLDHARRRIGVVQGCARLPPLADDGCRWRTPGQAGACQHQHL